jgi:hypothetical protein
MLGEEGFKEMLHNPSFSANNITVISSRTMTMTIYEGDGKFIQHFTWETTMEELSVRA